MPTPDKAHIGHVTTISLESEIAFPQWKNLAKFDFIFYLMSFITTSVDRKGISREIKGTKAISASRIDEAVE